MRYPETESSILEFKRELPKNDQIIKTIIAFCNQNGGKLIIGVSDSGEIEGLNITDLEQALNSMGKAIFDATYPPIIPRVFSRRFGEKNTLEIEVSSGMSKPYYRKSEGKEKGTYIRLGRSTLRATPELIKELEWQSSGLSFETMPRHQANEEEIDLKRFEYFLSIRKSGAKAESNRAMLKAYNLIIEEHSKIYPTTAGILLFGKNPQKFLSEAMIICSHFRGISGREALATIDCEGDLFNQYHQAENFILNRLSRSYQIQSSKRTEILEIPQVAIREALLNAIVHRNYHLLAPTKIAIYENRIEIFSPGQFPGPLDLKNPRSGITYLRNPVICKVFRESGYIEKIGSGLITIFDSYETQNLVDPQIIEGENYVKCILPRIKKQKKLIDHTEVILALFDIHPEVTLDQIQHALSISRSTAVRRINELIKQKKVIRIGKTRSTRFCRF
ncbi:MAG: putative DNA binding domain-containing protein [Chlamydiales bacterium]|nr:putative DNA binding domain-containing protein [Chlamydiales bacterium]